MCRRHSASAQAVMLHMRDGNYHTMRAFPFIERALESVSPSDLHTHLDATHDTLPEIARSLGVWARYPLLEKNRALGFGVEEQMYKLAAATWNATQVATRDAVLTASMVYGETTKDAHMVPFSSSYGYGGSGPHKAIQGLGGSGKSNPAVTRAVYESLAGSTMDFMNAMSATAASGLPLVREVLSELPYPRSYMEWIAADTSISAARSGITATQELLSGISLALEVVPHFTVDGEPVVELLDAALDRWLRPLYRVGATWEQVCAYERSLVDAFRR